MSDFRFSDEAVEAAAEALRQTGDAEAVESIHRAVAKHVLAAAVSVDAGRVEAHWRERIAGEIEAMVGESVEFHTRTLVAVAARVRQGGER